MHLFNRRYEVFHHSPPYLISISPTPGGIVDARRLLDGMVSRGESKETLTREATVIVPSNVREGSSESVGSMMSRVGEENASFERCMGVVRKRDLAVPYH